MILREFETLWKRAKKQGNLVNYRYRDYTKSFYYFCLELEKEAIRLNKHSKEKFDNFMFGWLDFVEKLDSKLFNHNYTVKQLCFEIYADFIMKEI